MFPKRERQYLQHSQEGLSADLGPDHLDITHLEASLCPLRPALQIGSHSSLGTSLQVFLPSGLQEGKKLH